MMNKIYQVDAFSSELFAGNPASVCPLNDWLSDGLLQKIAMENNQAETCFYVRRKEYYEIRWFTPCVEVDLCGHATLAAARVIYTYDGYWEKEINFVSPKSGLLTVSRQGELLILDIPSDVPQKTDLFPDLLDGFNIEPIEAYKGKTDYMLVFDSEETVRNIIPDLQAVSKLKCRGVIVTAKGSKTDFVSRFFAPQSGIPEDPVTGSAHATLTPYWSKTAGKNILTATQLSKRGGEVFCENLGERIKIGGYTTTYMIGEIYLV